MTQRLMHTIANWTLAEFFRSWLGWISMMGFALLNGLTLSMLLWDASNPTLAGQGVALHSVIMPKYFSTMNLLLLIILPALTMHSISGEQTSHRLKLYQMAPLTSNLVILGKALGTMFLLDILLLSTLPLMGILSWFSDPDWTRWGLGYLGTCLHGALIITLGIWASAHTQKPLTSWFLTTSMALLLWFLGTAQSFPLMESISPLSKLQEYLDGWIGILDTFYFFSVGTFFLYHAQDGLSAKRYPNGRSWNLRLTPLLWFVVMVLSNILVSRYDRYWDINDARPTLSEESLSMLSNQNLELVVDLEETDFRYRMLTQQLRTIDAAGITLPIQWLNNQTRSPGNERGVTWILNDEKGKRELFLSSIHPWEVESSLRRLLYPEKITLCFTQNGGEGNVFDGASPKGFGLLSEELLRLDYDLKVVDPLQNLSEHCSLFVVAGRTTQLKMEWLNNHLDKVPSILLIDPAENPIPVEWSQKWGVQLKDDFVIEVNPKFQIYGNPTTLLLSKYSLIQHPALSIDNQNLLLSEARSVARIEDNTQTLTVELLHASAQSWAETNYTSDTPSPDSADIIGNVPLLVEVDSIQSGTPKPHLMVMGTSSIIQNAWVEQNQHNAQFFIQMIQHLLADDRPASAIPSDATIQMTTAQVRSSSLLSVVFIPGLIGVLGLWRRRL